MSITNIICRVDIICKKYEKYNVELQEQSKTFNNDAFMRLYSVIESTMLAIEQKSNDVSIEENRAVSAIMNAEIRKAKSAISLEFPKLEKLSHRKVYGVSKENLLLRPQMATELIGRIENIPDGFNSTGSYKRTGKPFMPKKSEIKLGNFCIGDDVDQFKLDMKMTEEGNSFKKEYDQRKMNQESNLDAISVGLMTLKNMAHDLNEEMDKQAPLIDEIETKIDFASTNLRDTNKRLKDTLHQVRSGRKVFMDVILICVLLGIGTTLYAIFK